MLSLRGSDDPLRGRGQSELGSKMAIFERPDWNQRTELGICKFSMSCPLAPHLRPLNRKSQSLGVMEFNSHVQPDRNGGLDRVDFGRIRGLGLHRNRKDTIQIFMKYGDHLKGNQTLEGRWGFSKGCVETTSQSTLYVKFYFIVALGRVKIEGRNLFQGPTRGPSSTPTPKGRPLEGQGPV